MKKIQGWNVGTMLVRGFLLVALVTAIFIPDFVIVTSPVFAGEKTEDEDNSSVFALESLVVTATRSKTDLRGVPASLSSVGKTEIEMRGALDAKQILAGIPNVRVEQDSDHNPQIYIRGIPHFHSNNNVLILMDGIPLQTVNDEANISRVPFYNIDRVEVVRGPVSALYGRNGVSGVINYITKDPAREHIDGMLKTTIGSDGLQQTSFTVGGPVIEDRFNISMGGLRNTNDGWRKETESKSINICTKSEVIFTDNTNVLFHVNWYDTKHDKGTPIPLTENNVPLFSGDAQKDNWNSPGANQFNESLLVSATLNHQFTNDLKLRTIFKYGHEDRGWYGEMGGTELDQENHTIGWSIFDGTNEEKSYFIEPQLDWATDLSGHQNRFLIGASYERIDADELTWWYGDNYEWDVWRVNYLTGDRGSKSEKIKWQSADATTEADYMAIFVQNEFDMTDKATVSLGLRYDAFKRTTLYRPTDTTDGANVKGDKDHFSPKVSLNYRWTEDLSTYVTYAHAFNPNFGPVWMYNEDYAYMNPETINSYEVGVRAHLFDRRLFVSICPFFMEREDVLVMVSGDDGESHPDTAGRQEVFGFELESDLNLNRLADGLKLFANYGYTRSKWKDYRYESYVWGEGWVTYDWSDKKVNLMPEHNFSVGVNYSHPEKNFGADLWYDYTGSWWVDPANQYKSDAYGLLNVKISYQPPLVDGLKASLTVKNITDEEYYPSWSGDENGLVSVYPGDPVTVVGSVSMTF
jgi:iron complex outermembrane receptor protein